jgi:hypothetical protein
MTKIKQGRERRRERQMEAIERHECGFERLVERVRSYGVPEESVQLYRRRSQTLLDLRRAALDRQ